MYKESWGEKRICPMCSKQYYDLGRSELECPECGKQIEVTTMSRPRRGRKPGSTNAAPLVIQFHQKLKKKMMSLILRIWMLIIMKIIWKMIQCFLKMKLKSIQLLMQE